MFIYSENTEVEAVCADVMETLLVPSEPIVSCAVDILKQIENVDADSLKQVMGVLGQQLRSFVEVVDVNHPSLSWMSDNKFDNNSEFTYYLDECCKFVELSKGQPFTVLPKIINDHFNEFSGVLSFLLKKPPTSLYKDKQKRDSIRKECVPNCFEMSDFADLYNLLPETFLPYVRCGRGFRDEIAKNVQTLGTLNDLGLKSQVKALSCYNEELTNTAKDTCYGFVRLRLLQAAVILAKNMGCKFSDNKITVAGEFFKDLNILYRAEDEFVFQPRVYPISKAPFAHTKYVQELIEKLEGYAPIGGFPIFDRYHVLVPTIKIPLSKEEKPYLRGDNGDIKYFDDIWSACHAFDNRLVESKLVHPIILGENRTSDGCGKCYFISYFC